MYILPVAIVMILLLIMFMRTEYSLGKIQQIRYFRLMLFGLSITMISTILAYVTVYLGASDGILGWVATMGSYLPTTFAFMCWVKFLAATTRFKWEQELWWRILMLAPLLLVAIYLATPFYKDVLIFGADGTIDTGSGEYFLVGIDCLYLWITIFIFAMGWENMQRRADRRIYLALFIFFLCVILGEILGTLISEVPMFELMLLPGCLVLYSELLLNQVYSDALTGLNNRRKVDDFLESALANASEEHAVEWFTFDLDHFKSINDVLGHNEGDRALVVFADALRKSAQTRGSILGRYGGDEFVMAVVDGLRDPAILYGRLEQNLSELCRARDLGYKLSFSMGYAISSQPGMSRIAIQEQADRDLYRTKEEHHNQMGDQLIEALQRVKLERAARPHKK